MKSLSFEQIDARYEDISEPHDSTCEWITKHPTYIEWIDPHLRFVHHGFLWIRGKAGVGKSTIMKHLYETAKEDSQSNEIVLAFFFHARGGELEKSTIGLYRSLLSQLLTERPDLQSVLNACDSSSWRLNKLRMLLSKAVSQLRMASLTIFIDALDECEEAEGLAMVRQFQREVRDAFANAVALRVCFSSQPYPVVDMRKGLLLVLEDEEGHDYDICEYVRYELESWPEKLQEDLGSKIIARARGIFLWAALVLNLLAQDLRRGHVNASRLEQRLERLPAQLSGLFREIIQQERVDTEELKLSMQWALYSYVPLRPIAYYRAMMVGLEPADENTYAPLDPAVVNKEMLERFVRSTSRGLLEVTAHSGTVQFIHESTRDFFLKDDGMEELFKHEAHDEATCHERLKKICHRYFDCMSRATQPYWSKEYVIDGERVPSKDDKIIVGFGPDSSSRTSHLDEGDSFHRYAIDGMLWHAEVASTAFAQVGFVSSVDFTLWRINYGGREPKYTKSMSTQFIMACENRPLLLGQLINHAGMVDDAEYVLMPRERARKRMTPLQVAVELDSLACVKVLLEQGCKPDVYFDSNSSETLLHEAAMKHSTELTHLLLKHGAPPRVYDKWGRTPLDRALRGCHFETALVLYRSEMNGRAETFEFRGDVSFARAGAAALSMLLDSGLDVNHRIVDVHHTEITRSHVSFGAWPGADADPEKPEASHCDREEQLGITHQSLLQALLDRYRSAVEILDVLLERVTIHDGTSAEVSCDLCSAVTYSDPEIVERLIGTGIRLHEDPYALHSAVERLNRSLP